MKTNLFLFVVILIVSCQNRAGKNESVEENTVERIRIEGNKFVNESGETIVFRGLNASDPHKLYKSGNWQKSYFDQMKAWGANIVRFPVHPPRWNDLGQDK